MKVTTKRGDSGRTRIGGQRSVLKCDPRIRAEGALDELASFLGLAKTKTEDRPIKDIITSIQKDIFRIAAEIGKCEKNTIARAATPISAQDIKRIEKLGDSIENRSGGPSSFVLPGVNEESAMLHVARTVARRAECGIAELNKRSKINPSILAYLNRLSDLLFVLAVSCEDKSDIL